MSAGKRQRSSWRVQAIRRGDLKISGPIPIYENKPPGAREGDHTAIHDRPPSTHEQAPPPQPDQPLLPTNRNGAPRPPALQREPDLPASRPEPSPRPSPGLGLQNANEMQRRSDFSAFGYTPSPPPGASPKSTPRRKRKSGLRSVIRRVFGRKRDDVDGDPIHKSSHHSSDPNLLSQRSFSPKRDVGQQRISELPVREPKPINPLGAQLPFPMNVNAPQEISPPHEYLTFDRPTTTVRRRATLPSVVVSQAEAQALAAPWGASEGGADERHLTQTESIPSPQIGVALSSPTHFKRRSRSADALRDLDQQHASMERRRSEEIRYWRKSGVASSVSVYSSHTPRPQTADNTSSHGGIPETTIQEERRSLPEHQSVDGANRSVSGLPVEAFNFGDLNISGLSEAKRQTPSSRPASSAEVTAHQPDTHVHSTEAANVTSEHSYRQTVILESPPKGRRSRGQSPSTTSTPPFSRLSSKGSSRAMSLKHEYPPCSHSPPIESAMDKKHASQQSAEAVSLESSTVHPRLMSQSADPVEQLAAICTVLQHERAARKSLEQQVCSLQREVSDMRSLINKTINYPMPSPDATIDGSEDRLATPRAVRRANQSPGYGATMDGLLIPRAMAFRQSAQQHQRETMISRFSQSDSEVETGEDDRAEGQSVSSSAASKDGIMSPDDWATPREEFTSIFGASRSRIPLPTDGEDEIF